VGGCSTQNKANDHQDIQVHKLTFDERIQEKMDMLDISGWKIHMNEEYGYSLKYDPAVWDSVSDSAKEHHDHYTYATAFNTETHMQGWLFLRKTYGRTLWNSFDIGFLQTEQQPDDWFAEVSKTAKFDYIPGFKRSEFISEASIDVIHYSTDITNLEETGGYFEVLFIQKQESQETVLLTLKLMPSPKRTTFNEGDVNVAEALVAHFLKAVNTFTFME